MIAQEGIRGGMSPRLSKAEVERCGLPSRATFQTVPWIRISIRKEQDKRKLCNIKGKAATTALNALQLTLWLH